MAKKIVFMKLVSMKPDPVQYKPYDILLTSQDGEEIVVQFEVSETEVLKKAKGEIVLTPDGVAEVAMQLAKAIKSADIDFKMWAAKQ